MEKNEKISIKYDAFVKAVRPDPKSTENTVYLEGFIGESSIPNHFRLYSDASLNDFVEIPTDAVIHSIAHSKEESPLGGSKLWVKQDAIYTYGNPAMANRPQGSFLDGDLYQGYMDSMYQPDASGAGADMGAMGGGISQPITGCINPIPKTILCPVASRIVVCPTKFCPSKLICPTKFCPSKLICPTFGACPSIACNPGGGGRPFDGSQGMTDPSGGSFNPYFDGDLYQGYMDSMYQPDASGAGMGAMGGGISQPITGCINPTPQTIISKPIICRKSLLTPCVTKPFSPICNNLTRPIVCQIPKTIVGCPQITTTIGPIKSIADCPSFPCPTPTFRTETINPNPFSGTGAMADPLGGSFNPYFDGDLYQGYMDSMYQPDANTQSGDAGAMGGAATVNAICGTVAVSIACPIRTQPAICNIQSRVICPPSRFTFCITRDNRASVCIICPPWTWTRPPFTFTTTRPTTIPTTTFPTTGPVFDPRAVGGGQQFGGDFYGSFDPYSGY